MTHSTSTVYALHGPDGVARYVGQTVNSLRKRLGRHRYAARQGSTLLVCGWIRDVGPENVEIRKLEVCAYTDRLDRERHWIGELNTSVPDGGCNQWVRGKMAGELLETLRAAGVNASRRPRPNAKGRTHSEATRAKMRASQLVAHQRWLEAERRRIAGAPRAR